VGATRLNRRRAVVVFSMAAFLGISSAFGQASTVAAASPITPRSLVRLTATLASPLRPLLSALEGTDAISNGSDGRLTFLLIGSDSRASSISRTDSIMIVSLKGKTISAASIPRDTGRIPNPFDGGVFPGKVNSILHRLRTVSANFDQALDRFEVVIENVIQQEIDYHALLWFDGFSALVDKVEPVIVNVGREIADPKHEDDEDGPPGVYFPKATTYALYAKNTGSNPYCNGAYKSDPPPVDARYWCHRALPFVRSRKGPGNNDWVRSQRQQGFVAATIKAISRTELNSLVSTAQSEGMGKWWTNLPINSSTALDLYNALDGARLVNQVVFKPKTYAGRIVGTSSYALNLTAVRQWAAQYLS
jgi:anionic cell wall polymer biosynthesis LytR-Cps2A-Psr (LCP) family protein